MSRYRRVHVTLWTDAKIRNLSAPPPNARDLFVYLLTCPETTSLPGLIVAGPLQLAEALGWEPAALVRVLDELEAAGLVQSDRRARVLFLPNAAKHNPPENPNVVRGWRRLYEEIPECALRERAMSRIAKYVESLTQPFINAFREAFPQPFEEPPPDPSERVPVTLPSTLSKTGAGSGEGSETPLTPRGGAVGGEDSSALDEGSPPTGQQPLLPDVASGPAAEAARIRELWGFYMDLWREHIGHGDGPVLSEERKRVIRRALRTHGPEKARALVSGLWLSRHHREEGYHDITYAFRSKSEGKFIGLAKGTIAPEIPAAMNGPPPDGPGQVRLDLRNLRPPQT